MSKDINISNIMRKKILPFLMLFFILFIPSTAGLTVEKLDIEGFFYDSPANISATIDNAEASTEYSIHRVLKDQTTEEIYSFTTDSLGRQKIDFKTEPHSNNVLYENYTGFKYEIYKSSTGENVRNLSLSYGYDMSFLDTFYDNNCSIVFDCYKDYDNGYGGCRETNQYQEAWHDDTDSATDRSCLFNRTANLESNAIFVDFESSQDSSSSSNLRYYLIFSGNQYNIETTSRTKAFIYYDYGNNELVVENATGGNTLYSTSIDNAPEGNLKWGFEYDIGISETKYLRIYDFSIIPRSNINDYTNASTFGIDSSQEYTWSDYFLKAPQPDETGIKFNSGQGWTGFFSDLEPSKELQIRNEKYSPIQGLYLLTEPSKRKVEILYPTESFTYKTDPIDNITFTERLDPVTYDLGELFLQLKTADSTEWTTLTLPINDLDGSCVEDPNFITSTCYEHTLEIEDIENTLSGLPPGEHDLRLFYNTSYSTDPEAQDDKFYSQEISFRKLAVKQELSSLYPPNNTVLTDLKPEFTYDLLTLQSGEMNVIIDGNNQKSISITDSYNGLINYIPDTGLTEGDHTYKGKFVGQDGAESITETRTFTINSSLANNFNYTFYNPPDGYSTKERDIDLEYSIETENPGTLEVYLNNEMISNKTVSSGASNLSTSLINQPIGSYNWYLKFKDSTISKNILSESREFTISEDVSIGISEPENNKVIKEPKIYVKGNLGTNTKGTLKVLIDGNSKYEEDIPSGYNNSIDYILDYSDIGYLDRGTHTIQLKFEYGLGKSIKSESRTIDLTVEIKELPKVEGGELGKMLEGSLGDLFGTDRSGTLTVASLLLSAVLSLGAGALNPIFGGVIFTGSIISFSAIGWFPPWGSIILAIISGYLIAKELSGRV